jgi:anaerobic selenocysteine-containing dehydrogenase
VRSHDQYNTTIYGLDDRYRGVHGGRRVVFVHPDDLASLGFADGELVDLVSEWTDGSQRRAPRFRTSRTRPRRGAPRRTSRRPTCWCRWTRRRRDRRQPTSKQIIVRLEPPTE